MRSIFFRIFVVLSVSLFAAGGCTVNVMPGNDNGGDVGNSNGNSNGGGNHNDNGGGNGNSGGGFVDSDGDGFSDTEELNDQPATDPNDPEDNPDHVIDNDGDGCSDFEETQLDGFCDENPNTPPGQIVDTDDDGFVDDEDNCPTVFNPDQLDFDEDGFGDACDNCSLGDDLFDIDSDDVPDDCDNCPNDFNPDQEDTNDNGVGDACELVTDIDADGVPDVDDNCPLTFNPTQLDGDSDGLGDACDGEHDSDADGVADEFDDCPVNFDPDQSDLNDNGIGDACEPVNPVMLILVDVYGVGAVEFDDGSVWEINVGTVIDWQPGDRILAENSMLNNTDSGNSVQAFERGNAIAHSDIVSTMESGRFVELADGTVWEIAVPDLVITFNWLPTEPVIVVESVFHEFALINGFEGIPVEAVPAP